MNTAIKNTALFAIVAALILITGFVQSWNSALLILNMGLISAIMALGVNLQWGIAGLFNVGIMGFVALGGLATVIVSMAPVGEAWRAGGLGVFVALAMGAATIALTVLITRRKPPSRLRTLALLGTIVGGFFLFRAIFDPSVSAIEAINPASTGNLGGLGLPILLAWPVGGLFAAGAAWVIGKTAPRAI
jgi:branched-chain amino acid transport system permease protein